MLGGTPHLGVFDVSPGLQIRELSRDGLLAQGEPVQSLYWTDQILLGM